MKKIYWVLMVVGSLASVAEGKVFLSRCSSYGTGVSFSFAYCINDNFSSVERVVDRAFFSNCFNLGSGVSLSFVSCVQRNFDEARREIDSLFSLSHCSNRGEEELDWSFVSCVNGNFSRIERALNNASSGR